MLIDEQRLLCRRKITGSRRAVRKHQDQAENQTTDAAQANAGTPA
jgi:hypothetical protein